MKLKSYAEIDHAMLRSLYFFLSSIRQDCLNLLLINATKLITSTLISFFPPSASMIDKILIFLTVNPSPCILPALVTLSSPFTMHFAPLAIFGSSESSFSPQWISPVNQPTRYSYFLLSQKTLSLMLYFLIAFDLFLFHCVPLQSQGLKNNLYANCLFPNKASSWSSHLIYSIVNLMTPFESLGINTLHPLPHQWIIHQFSLQYH